MPKKGGATRIEGLAAEGIKGEAEQSLVRHTLEEIGREAGGGGDLSCGGHALPQLVEMPKCCGEREGRERAHEGGG